MRIASIRLTRIVFVVALSLPFRLEAAVLSSDSPISASSSSSPDLPETVETGKAADESVSAAPSQEVSQPEKSDETPKSSFGNSLSFYKSSIGNSPAPSPATNSSSPSGFGSNLNISKEVKLGEFQTSPDTSSSSGN